MERISSEKSGGSLPLVLGLTALVVVVPCLAAIGLRAAGLVTSTLLLVLIPVVVSVLISHSISLFWKRRRAGSPLLFEDLMLWGWLRRRRFERLLARTEEFVGPGGTGRPGPDQRAHELERLAAALEARDPRTHGHSRRVARHATSIARDLRLPTEEVARIRTAALLHDVGKIEISRDILEKPDGLTKAEYEEMKGHAAAGARLVEGMGDPELAAIVRHHHERIDGGGYPDGLFRGQIPLGARIIAVADTFDALTSARCYRQPHSHEEALVVLREVSGTQLDARAVRTFDARYSDRKPVALVAAALGLGRQAGQALVGFGTGATQVAAVGAAAVVIGAAPVVDGAGERKSVSERPALVRETGGSTPTSGTSAGRGAAVQSGKVRRSRNRPVARLADGRTRPRNEMVLPDGLPRAGGDGRGGGGAEGGGPGTDSGGSTGGSGGSGTGGPVPGGGGGPVATVTETVQKPLQQVTEQVTQAVPALPGDGPVSQGVNDTVDGVKDTLGKLTGKP